MCRIAGIISKNRQTLSHIDAMRDSMHRGGPDDCGSSIDEAAGLALGHRRLSIIDLSASGHQPMQDGSGDYEIIYNGEIYNFGDIRSELATLGVNFRSHTDTEVVIEAYKKWGTESFRRFNGMYAFALHDKKKQELIIARDQVGIKPLYYGADKNGFYFASEVRAFKKINPEWKAYDGWQVLFMAYGFIPEPFTILDGVQSLKPGHFIRYNLADNTHSTHRFFSFQFEHEITDKAIAVSALEKVCDEAVQRHLICDAPIGVFLSGGIDSSVLTALSAQHVPDTLFTLSITFSEAEFSELQYQKLIADRYKTNHQTFEISDREFFDELPDIFQAYDQPSIDGINTYFISKYARKSGLSAVLSGVGADELLGGYPSFKRAEIGARLAKLPSWALSMMTGITQSDSKKRIGYLRADLDKNHYLFHRGIFTPQQIAAFLDVSVAYVNEVLSRVPELEAHPGDPREMNAHREFNYYMRSQLLRDSDIMGMWHSLEIRVPFLDSAFIQTVWNIAPEVKFGHPQGKHLLIESMKQYLPEAIYNRKKQGFTFPFSKWLREMESRTPRLSNEDPVRKQFLDHKMHWSKYWVYMNSKTGAQTVGPEEVVA